MTDEDALEGRGLLPRPDMKEMGRGRQRLDKEKGNKALELWLAFLQFFSLALGSLNS